MWTMSVTKRVSIRASLSFTLDWNCKSLNFCCELPFGSKGSDAVNPLALVFSFDIFGYFVGFKYSDCAAFKFYVCHC